MRTKAVPSKRTSPPYEPYMPAGLSSMGATRCVPSRPTTVK
jgi:hypothetical protein